MAKLENLTIEITQALEEYTTEIEEALEKKSEEIAKEAVKELKETSPERFGDYAKGWSQKKGPGGKGRVIFNRKKPGLTHLLEKGHRKRGGKGFVFGIPHIGLAESRAINRWTTESEKIIKGK